jgi:hypothetical protein
MFGAAVDFSPIKAEGYLNPVALLGSRIVKAAEVGYPDFELGVFDLGLLTDPGVSLPRFYAGNEGRFFVVTNPVRTK